MCVFYIEQWYVQNFFIINESASRNYKKVRMNLKHLRFFLGASYFGKPELGLKYLGAKSFFWKVIHGHFLTHNSSWGRFAIYFTYIKTFFPYLN